MGPRKYPPLTPSEIISILLARGFTFHHSSGDHNYYVHVVRGVKKIAQVDTGNPQYTNTWISLIMEQAGMTREEFYCSTKTTAKKINHKCASAEDLRNWVLA
jgi:predicted RNA binding protein YcfA (HicA-like mRNA interferase family)